MCLDSQRQAWPLDLKYEGFERPDIACPKHIAASATGGINYYCERLSGRNQCFSHSLQKRTVVRDRESISGTLFCRKMPNDAAVPMQIKF